MTNRRTAAIIGFPLGHSMSPPMHNAGFKALGMDVQYEAWPIPVEELPATVQRLRDPSVLGISVTVPYKQAVMPLVDEVDAAADAIGSVNTLVRRGNEIIGYNTDKDGFIRSLREAGCEPAGLRVLVLGVGGTERAVAYGLAEAGAASITLAGRNAQRVATAAEHLRPSAGKTPIETTGFEDAELIAAVAESDLVVNTTPVGMLHSAEEHRSPLPKEAHRAGLWVADVVYNPLQTVLLREAVEAGAKTVDGLGMLVYQGVQQQVLWTGTEPPGDIMREAALAAMAAQG